MSSMLSEVLFILSAVVLGVFMLSVAMQCCLWCMLLMLSRVLFILSVIMLSAVRFSGIMRHVFYFQWSVVYPECLCAGCLYAECCLCCMLLMLSRVLFILNVITLSAVRFRGVMPLVVNAQCSVVYLDGRYAKCLYAECHYAEYHHAACCLCSEECCLS
jgi:hypothetical protein